MMARKMSINHQHGHSSSNEKTHLFAQLSIQTLQPSFPTYAAECGVMTTKGTQHPLPFPS